ncbi:MAG: hypothetical protein PG981_000705 [Wolbachia endosymbiont of Ctenocephalides orientis wCori]|nr:MAG: hypothetical protein PG981_000705 [Wolbachia endosymbiont of Ctenocephalides orientis wCori]
MNVWVLFIVWYRLEGEMTWATETNNNHEESAKWLTEDQDLAEYENSEQNAGEPQLTEEQQKIYVHYTGFSMYLSVALIALYKMNQI